MKTTNVLHGAGKGLVAFALLGISGCQNVLGMLGKERGDDTSEASSVTKWPAVIEAGETVDCGLYRGIIPNTRNLPHFALFPPQDGGPYGLFCRSNQDKDVAYRRDFYCDKNVCINPDVPINQLEDLPGQNPPRVFLASKDSIDLVRLRLTCEERCGD